MKMDLNLNEMLEEKEADMNAHAVLIRHAQSEANAGLRTSSHNKVRITSKGEEQANYLSQFWGEEAPSVIGHSSYSRTLETAGPTIKRFPKVPVFTFPVQEFTFLNPELYKNTSFRERKQEVENYWKDANPNFRASSESESFSDFWYRADFALEMIKRSQPGQKIFSHRRFINMINFMFKFPEFKKPTVEAMKQYHIYNMNCWIQNTARVEIRKNLEGVWEIDEPKIAHLPEELITI